MSPPENRGRALIFRPIDRVEADRVELVARVVRGGQESSKIHPDRLEAIQGGYVKQAASAFRRTGADAGRTNPPGGCVPVRMSVHRSLARHWRLGGLEVIHRAILTNGLKSFSFLTWLCF